MFLIGWKRAIEEDDMYAVKDNMRSDSNTEGFAKLWELECKKKNPSLLRIMVKMYLYKVLPIGFLFAVGETLAKYETWREFPSTSMNFTGFKYTVEHTLSKRIFSVLDRPKFVKIVRCLARLIVFQKFF